MDIFEWWEELKQGARKIFKQVGIETTTNRKNNILNLNFALNELHVEIAKSDVEEQVILDSIQLIKTQIQYIEQDIAQGAIIRSKALWHREGEKNYKYLFALKRKRAMNNTMTKIKRADGTIITEEDSILKEQFCFYQELYRYEKTEFNIQNTTGIKISRDDLDMLNEEISVEELYSAVSSMKAGKSPGNDGLPAEFYMTFWQEIKCDLIMLYGACFRRGSLNKTVKQGIISLLPKGTKNPNYLKNWRPLTLLNVDYKIILKLLATRLKATLPSIIAPQQTGIMESRHIMDNII